MLLTIYRFEEAFKMCQRLVKWNKVVRWIQTDVPILQTRKRRDGPNMRQGEEEENNDGSRRNVLVNEWIEEEQNIKGAWNRETGPKERDAGSIGEVNTPKYSTIVFNCCIVPCNTSGHTPFRIFDTHHRMKEEEKKTNSEALEGMKSSLNDSWKGVSPLCLHNSFRFNGKSRTFGFETLRRRSRTDVK